MSDNLKVAKECGATELGDQSYYTGVEWKDCPRLVFSGDVLDAYTSRILASQQAAHEAEIAKLKADAEFWKNEKTSMDDIHSSAMVEIAKTCGEDVDQVRG